jgi:hypothetical protein
VFCRKFANRCPFSWPRFRLYLRNPSMLALHRRTNLSVSPSLWSSRAKLTETAAQGLWANIYDTEVAQDGSRATGPVAVG